MAYPAAKIAVLINAVQDAINNSDLDTILLLLQQADNLLLVQKYFEEKKRKENVIKLWKNLIPELDSFSTESMLSIYDNGLTNQQINNELFGLNITTDLQEIYNNWLSENGN